MSIEPSDSEINALANDALDAFWAVVADHFPQATSGELSIDTTIRFQIVAEEAIAEWIDSNVSCTNA